MRETIPQKTPYLQLLEDVIEADVVEALGYREDPSAYEEAEPALRLERPLPEWRDVVSDAAYEFILKWETGGKLYFEQVIKGRPVWPGFSSGITIGCGYDLGYHTQPEFAAGWSGRVPAATMRRLNGVIGFRTTDPGRAAKVARAKELARLLSDIVIPWETAVSQFDASKMPALVAALERALPNLDLLHPHCYGALLSLVFNRGTPFRNPAPRYAEMVQVGKLMEQGSLSSFAKIPAQLRSMERIWGANSSLAKRRHGEAQLFELGLRETEILAGMRAIRPEAAASPGAEQHESVEVEPTDDPVLGLAGEEEELLPGRLFPEASGLNPNHVVWHASDDNQPDYRHLDTRHAGKVFEFLPGDLDLLIRCNFFQIPAQQPLVIFALRGARLVGAPVQLDLESVTVQDQRPDHRTFRCIIGVYSPAHRRISAFQASTVPNARYVHMCYAQSQAGAPLGSLTGNILPTGCYTYTAGIHKAGQPGEIRGALRLSKTSTGADFVIVLRSLEDVTYDRLDVWHKCAPADNIHPAQLSAGFSSAGCLTVPGFFRKGRHTGAWAQFRNALGLSGQNGTGRQFRCVLLTGLDAAVAAALREQEALSDQERVREHLVRLRHGSQGELVRKLQDTLGLAPDASQLMGPVTRGALVQRQQERLGWADGILSPAVDRELGFGVL
jgi:hypothetical protein